MIRTRHVIVAAGAILSIVASCTPSEEAQSATVDTTNSARASALAPLAVAGTRYVVSPAGNEVRYRVREQLVGIRSSQRRHWQELGCDGRDRDR